jgi:hypothetical protein
MNQSITVTGYPKKAGLKGQAAVKQMFDKYGQEAMAATRRGIAKAGLEMFRLSMNMVPYKTGKLAKSGRVTIGNKIIARGTFNSIPGVEELPEAIKIPKNYKANRNINLIIRFRRVIDEEDIALQEEIYGSKDIFFGMDVIGEDITALIHEFLPLGTGPLKARHERSGKFIEAPMLQIAPQVQQFIMTELLKVDLKY